MIDSAVLLTILVMAFVTYTTRIIGYLLLYNRRLSPRLAKVLEAIPGCVLIAVIAPAFASGHLANLLALVITLLLACRYSLLPTVIISIIVTALLRYYIPY